MIRQRAVFALLLAALAVAAGLSKGRADVSGEAALAQAVAKGLIAACPVADPGDEQARDRAADRLARFSLLRDTLSDPIYWGAHTPGASYRPEDNPTTLFNPFVWRRLYLSLFMFPGDYRIERAEPYTILRLSYCFRNGLEIGAYPYPFWHSKKKWDSYQLATELLLVFEQGKIVAAYRSEQQDLKRPYVAHMWDGQWRWTDKAGHEMPYVALYRYLFSPSNPHVSRLDAAYRAFEAEARQQSCVVCHSPDNVLQMNPLRLLTFPNQALTVRHEIVTQLAQNRMPPPSGIDDEAERTKLLERAKAFAAVGDQALDYEGEFKPPYNR